VPIKAENKRLYPSNWRAISLDVRDRAGMRCQTCGIQNYAVGYRDGNGIFFRLCGSGPCDAAGEGLRWPSMTPIAYSEAREFAAASNTEADGTDAEGNRWFVIVLTVAHLDHDPRNCALPNLKALCQYCHLHYDADHHQQSAYETRRKGKSIGFDFTSTGGE
jgi:5-methylcytosine-specific restriction endonuclease McrA